MKIFVPIFYWNMYEWIWGENPRPYCELINIFASCIFILLKNTQINSD